MIIIGCISFEKESFVEGISIVCKNFGFICSVPNAVLEMKKGRTVGWKLRDQKGPVSSRH
jgi:hypothetical protein